MPWPAVAHARFLPDLERPAPPRSHKLFGWPILAAIHVADTARALEQLSDAQVIGEGMAALRQMYPGAPDPLQANVTRWAADPFARGAYRCGAGGVPQRQGASKCICVRPSGPRCSAC